MNCPKCGYAQEERLDCKKCGVVFSKYLALYSPAKAPADNPESTPHAATGDGVEMAEVQRSIRELSRRYSEVEFERAERHKLRDELRALDQRLQKTEAGALIRLAEFEREVAGVKDAHSAATEQHWADVERSFSQQLEPLVSRVSNIEAILESDHKRIGQIEAILESAVARLSQVELDCARSESDPGMAEPLQKHEQRLLELESMVREKIEQANSLDALKDAAELRGALQNVTMRYSEIGELKKNHLVLLNKIETLQQQMDAAKNGSSRPSETLHEVETEVGALRAEVRQIMKQLESLDGASKSPDALQSMKDEIDGCVRKSAEMAADFCSLRADVGQMVKQFEALDTAPETEPLKQEVGSLAQNLADFAGELTSLRAEIGRMQGQLTSVSEMVVTAQAERSDPQSNPLEEDVRTIREGLDEIRAFIHGVVRKTT